MLCAAVWYSVLLCGTLCCCVLLCAAMCCYVLLCAAVLVSCGEVLNLLLVDGIV
jgi:hypothetical protein